MFRSDPCICENQFICLPEIQLELSILLGIEQTVIFRLSEICAEHIDHIFTDFIAFLTDGRSHTGKDILWITTEFFLHLFNRHLSHPVHSASPAGMAGCYHLFHRIQKQKRYTVRVKCHQTDPRYICDQSIYICVIFFSCNTFAGIFSCHDPYVRRMGLMRADHMLRLHADCSCHSSVILVHMRGIIPSGIAQVHVSQETFTHSSKSGRNSMFYKPFLFKDRIFEKWYASTYAFVKDMLLVFIF